MNAELRKSGLTIVALGLLFVPAGPITGGLVESAAVRHAGALATSFGVAAFTFGCIQLARAKGRPWWFGLLGLANLVGLAILWFVVADRAEG